jgi:hypothetical protein
MKPSPANDNLIERTQRLWTPRLRRDLSREDARQLVENATGFFAILAEWSHAECLSAANDNDAHAAPDGSEVRHDR